MGKLEHGVVRGRVPAAEKRWGKWNRGRWTGRVRHRVGVDGDEVEVDDDGEHVAGDLLDEAAEIHCVRPKPLLTRGRASPPLWRMAIRGLPVVLWTCTGD